MKKIKTIRTLSFAQLLAPVLMLAGITLSAAPVGPTPQVPQGGGAPGPFPNTSVTAVNVNARGSTTFSSSVDVPGFEGQGPIAWSLNRYNRGDFAMRLAPANPTAALGNLGQGFIEFGDNAPTVAASQAWRPSRSFGVVIPTARQNGPINWNDGEGPFFPTVAIAWASSGPSYSMADGSFGPGDLDINTGRAGTHASSPEANFSFSATWFPFDQGWLGGDVGSPVVGDPLGVTPDGSGTWTQPNARAAGLTANFVKWLDFPTGSGAFGGLAELRLPGVNALEDGMIFTTSSDGGSDVNLVSVAPLSDGSAWLVTIREDSESSAEILAVAGQSEFQFVYVPFNAQRLVGGHIVGSNGSKRKAVGDFTVTRTSTGIYEMTIPGKTAANGTLLLQTADLEAGTPTPLATRAFLSYQFQNDKFVVQSRKTTSDTAADLADANFYVAWVDFANPLAPPDGPRFRSLPATVVSGDGVVAREAGAAAHTAEPEILVTTIDANNVGAYTDSATQAAFTAALVGRFYDPRTLTATGDPFLIIGNSAGAITRHDVKFNPVSKQYVVVANTRSRGTAGTHVMTIALVNPRAQAGAGSPVAKTFVHDVGAANNYDDVAVAVSSKNGNFLVGAEYAFPGEGEGVVGVLFDQTGTALTTQQSRLDRLQSIGDEDDPDVIYLEARDEFLYVSNTDNSNGSTGTLSNRIVASVVQTTPGAGGTLQTQAEQPVGDGLPAGPEGHPASLLNPFNGELITAYDFGNNQPSGDLAFTTIGAAPNYPFSTARPEVPYARGTAGVPFNHQHPQFAADPNSGVIVIGFNSTGSTAGLPSAYVFRALGPDGQPLPSQLGAASFLAESPGGLGNTVNYHNIVYSPVSDSFLAVFNTTPGVTYVAALQVTSSHLAQGQPTLAIQRAANTVEITWPSSATGFTLESTDVVAPVSWASVTPPPTQEGNSFKAVVTPTGTAKFYRLRK